MTVTDAGAERVGRRAWTAAAVLAGVYTFNFLDRQVLTVLQESVKRDLRLSDTQLGAVTGLAFALFYTVCGLPVAALADRFNRVRIVAAATALWSVFTALCGLATGFLPLALARMGVGVGEAGGSPPSYSILSDLFPPGRRGAALSVYSLGVPLGGTAGVAAGGLLAQHFGWRVAFLSLGGVGLVLTPLIPLLVREPARGAQDGPTATGGEPAPSLAQAVALFWRDPALRWTALAAGATAFVGYAMVIWTPSLLQRGKGMTLGETALWYAAVSGVMNFAGTLASGPLADRLARRSPAAYALLPAAATTLCLPCLWGAVLSQGWPTALLWLAGPALFNNVYLAPALAAVQNRTPPRRRAVAGALLLFALNLVGLGGGPLFVGLVSDALHPRLGRDALGAAMLWLTPAFAAAVACQLAAARALRRSAPA